MESAKIFLVLLCCISEVLSVRLSWAELISMSPSAPVGRLNSGLAVVSGGTGYLFGGQGPTSIQGDTWSFTVSSNSITWTNVGASPSPPARYGFVGGVVGNWWIISHGCDDEICYSDTWALDTINQAWVLLVNSSSQYVPPARAMSAGGVYPGQNELWLSMGENKFGRKFSDTWVLNVNTSGSELAAVWEEVSPGGGLDQYNPFLPHARSLHAGAPLTANTFVISGGCAGGGQVGGPCPIEDSWGINLYGNNSRVWQEYPVCPSGRTRGALVPVPGSEGDGFLLGGSQVWGPGVFPQQLILREHNASEVYVLRTSNTRPSWSRLQTSSPYPANLNGPSVAVDAANRVVYMFGGRTVEGNGAFQNTMWQLSGDGKNETNLGCPEAQFTYVHLHGVLMYVAWGVFFPLGVLLGRYYRWTWPCWFIFHIILQCLGVLLTVAGFVIIFLVGFYSQPVFPHAIIGIVLTALMTQQFLSGIFHPCVDKENGRMPSDEKSTYRKCWEVYHAVSGFLTIGIGLGQVTLGVFLIDAPLVVWAVWAGLGGVWLVIFIFHEFAFLTYKLANRGNKIY